MSFHLDLSRYVQLVHNAWAELPGLVSVFVDRTSIMLDVPRASVEDAVAEVLGLPEYARLDGICQVMARTFIMLREEEPTQEESDWNSVAQQERAGLAWTALQAWQNGGLAAVGAISLRNPPLLARMPYERLAGTGVTLDPALVAQLAEDMLREMTGAALELRRAVLNGFTIGQGQGLTAAALDLAMDLADVLARTVAEPVPQLVVDLLLARDLGAVDLGEIEALWDEESGVTLDDWVDQERGHNPGLDELAEKFEATDGGHLQVWQLRAECVCYSPRVMANALDEGPSLFGVLTYAPAESCFQISATEEGSAEYLVPQVNWCGYAKSFEDIPALLRCAAFIPYKVEVLSREEAMLRGCPDLAGWYKLDWASCF